MTRTAITGAILAGGQSRRMGEPKPGVLLWDNRPMLWHVLDALTPVCDDLVVVGACDDTLIPTDVKHLADHRPGLGPLSGMEALLASGLCGSDHGRYLVVSCDQPLLTPELLARLARVTPQSDTGGALGFFCAINQPLDPFPGIYPAGWLGEVTRALDGKNHSIRDAIRQTRWPVHYEPLGNPDLVHQLHSMNTPQDIQQLLIR